MRKWLHEKASIVFLISLGIYILIWFTVSYICVKVTYFLGPIIFVSGLVAYLSRPKET